MLPTNLYNKWILLALSLVFLQFLPSWKLLLLLNIKVKIWSDLILSRTQGNCIGYQHQSWLCPSPTHCLSCCFPQCKQLIPSLAHGFSAESSNWASQSKQDTSHKLPQLWRAQLTGVTCWAEPIYPNFWGVPVHTGKPSRIPADRNMNPEQSF